MLRWPCRIKGSAGFYSFVTLFFMPFTKPIRLHTFLPLKFSSLRDTIPKEIKMKRILIATMLSTALLAAPVAQAASNQDRAMATGAVVGATAGGVVGASQNQALEGAIFGAVLGTIAGAVIASNQQAVYVAPQRTHYQPVVRHHLPVVRHYQPVVHHYKPVVKRYQPQANHYQPRVRQVAYARPQQHRSERYVAPRSYGHERGERD